MNPTNPMTPQKQMGLDRPGGQIKEKIESGTGASTGGAALPASGPWGLGDVARQIESQLAQYKAETIRLKESHSRLLQELEEARTREIASSTQIRTLTEHFNRAKQDLVRYQDAWAQITEKEKITQALLAEHEERKVLASEVGNELAMLRSQMICEKTSREEFERRNRALELEMTRLQSMAAAQDERAQSQIALVEQARQEVRYFQGLVDRHQAEVARVREQVSAEIRNETESRFKSELAAQKQTFDQLLADIETRYEADLAQRQARMEITLSDTERRYQAEIDAIKKSHALTLASRESRYSQEFDRIQTLTTTAVERLESRHEKDWAMIKVSFDQFMENEAAQKAEFTRIQSLKLDELEDRYQAQIRALTAELAKARASAEAREKEIMETAQSEIAALKNQLAAKIKAEEERTQAQSAVDQLASAQEARMEAQKKQFHLLKDILYREKGKLRDVAEQMNEYSRDELRQKLLSLAEI